MEVVLATKNHHKFLEIQFMAKNTGIAIEKLPDTFKMPPETGQTFVENAIIKARFVASKLNSWVLADDSGLVVEALHGKPGIHSARFAGVEASDEDNIQLLVKELHVKNLIRAKAIFVCVMVCLKHAEDPLPLISHGFIEGEVITERLGKSGFGYDPIFYLPSHQCTVAELPNEVKHTLSHRYLAFQSMMNLLKKEGLKSNLMKKQ